MEIPELIRSEEVPVWPPQKRSQNDEKDPENQEAEQECGDLPLSFFQRVVSVALRIGVDIRYRAEPDDDQTRENHPSQPRVVVDEHFLKAEEVPGCFRRIRRGLRVG